MFQEVSSASTIKNPNWFHTPVDLPAVLSPMTAPPDAYVPDTWSPPGSQIRSICWYSATCSPRNYRCRRQSHCSIASSCFLPDRGLDTFRFFDRVPSFVPSSFRRKKWGKESKEFIAWHGFSSIYVTYNFFSPRVFVRKFIFLNETF